MPDGLDNARNAALATLAVAAAFALLSLVPWPQATPELPTDGESTTIVQAWDPMSLPLANAPRGQLTVTPPWEPIRSREAIEVVVRPNQRLPRADEPREVLVSEVRGGLTHVALAPVGDDEAPAPDGPRQRTLASLIPQAEVAIVRPDGTRRVCSRWRFDRWECGPEEWLYVGPAEVTVRDREETCIWAHPTAEGTLEITLPPLPPASRITGQSALSDAGVANGEEGEIRMTLRRGEEELGVHRQPQRAGMRSFRYRIPVLPAAEEAPERDDAPGVEDDGSSPEPVDPAHLPRIAPQPGLAGPSWRPPLPIAPTAEGPVAGSGEAADETIADDPEGSSEDADPSEGDPTAADPAPEAPARETYTLSIDADTVAQRHFCFRGQVHFGPRMARRPSRDERPTRPRPVRDEDEDEGEDALLASPDDEDADE